MEKIFLIVVGVGLMALLLVACEGGQGPVLGQPGQVSLIFFYTEA